MKITFLGTSHGVPRADQYCSCTLIEVGEDAYLIDGGGPVGDLLIRHGIPFERIRAVFTTHMHGDHTLGYLGFCSLSNWKFKSSSYDMFLTEQKGIDGFRAVLGSTEEALDESRIRFRLVQPGVVYSDDNITVTAYATRHIRNGARPSYAYTIDCGGKRLIMTGDLHAKDAADFPRMFREQPSDLIVCEMAHFGHETIFPILAGCPTKRVLFNHINFHYEEEMAAIRDAEENHTLPFPVHALADGEVWEL